MRSRNFPNMLVVSVSFHYYSSFKSKLLHSLKEHYLALLLLFTLLLALVLTQSEGLG